MKVDRIQLEIAIKHDKARQEIASVTQQLQGETKELKNLEQAKKKALKKYKDESHPEVIKATQAYNDQAKKIGDLKARRDELRASLKVEGLSIAEVREELKRYNLVLSNLTPGTEKFNETKKHVDELKSRLVELNQNANNAQNGLLGFLDNANKVGFFFTNALDIKDRIVSWADRYVQSFAKMDDAMTDVMKYTGQTKQEVEEMNETFKQMTTRTPREELNALAGAAGRLGIQGKKDIEGFVDAADKINVALGDDLGEGAIDQIGKLTMVFGEDKTKGLNGAMLATGSAINVLGASSSANTGFITEFTSRMAGMAVNAKISQTDIMGYASALSQAGIEGETASGVFAQMITKMFTDPAKFAKAAGLEVKSFTELLKTDANQAILQFLQGLKQNGGFESLAPALKSLKMQGTQAVPVISSLINKMDELKSAQDTAKKAYDEGTSIIDEFNNANSSAAAQLEIAKKKLNDVSVELGRKLMPIVEGGIKSGTIAVQVISTLISATIRYTPVVVALTTAITALTVAENKKVIADKLSAFWTDKLKVATKGLFNTMKAHPYLLLVSAVMGLVTWLATLNKKTKEASTLQKDLAEAEKDVTKTADREKGNMEALYKATQDTNLSLEKRKFWIGELRKAYPDYFKDLTDEEILAGKAAGAYEKLSKEILSAAKARAYQKKIEELSDSNADIQDNIDDELDWLTKNEDKYRKAIAKRNAIDNSGVKAFNGNASVDNGIDYSFIKKYEDTENSVLKKQTQILDNERKMSAYSAKVAENSTFTPGSSSDGDGGGGGGNTNTTTDKERDKQRKEAEARLKADFEREKLLLKQQYQGKKELKDQWQLEEIDAERYYLSKLHDVRKQYNASESEMQEVQNQIMDTWIKEANVNEEARKREQQQKLKDIDQQQAADELQLARQQLTGEISTQKEYDALKLQCEIDYQKQRLQVLTDGTEEYQAAQARLEQFGLEQLKQQQSAKRDDQNWNNNVLQNSFGLMSSFDTMREANQAAYDQDLINFQQYQQNKTQIAEQEEQARQQIQQAAFNAVNGLLSSAGSLFSALQQRETSQVDKKYKKQIDAAKKAGKDTTKLEEQMEAEKAEIQKKYAQKQFKLQILQIIAATAQSIANIWKEWAWNPTWAGILTGIAAAQGAIQLATAKAQADAAAGLYEGGYSEGYTDKGNPRDQAGVIPVHKNEFVANHKAVANSQIRPVLDVIDRHQKAGDIQMLNATQMLEEAYGRGRYRGGYASRSEEGEVWSENTSTLDNPETLQLLRRIADACEDSLTVRELRREIKHQERLEQNAGR